MKYVDSGIVAAYFVVVLVASFLISRYHKKKTTDEEFITGGKTQSWYRVALTLFAMAADPAIMSLAGLGFLWGFYIIQWNSVHMWFTCWFSAMFIVPIYWRSRIVTTPEYLERRFSLTSRVIFSLLLTAILVVTLAGAVFMGALLLQSLLGWSVLASAILICLIIGIYVVMGGMKTVLTLDFYQGIFVILTLFTVMFVAMSKLGGLGEFFRAGAVGESGVDISTIIPPSDWSLSTNKFFPIQAVLTWAPVAGLGWLTCNYGMAQRLLAAKDEKNAQMGLMAVSILVIFYPMASYLIGGAVRILMPDIHPDEAFVKVLTEMFPVGLRGVLIAGMLAALLSTVDGMLTASSTLFAEDFYFRIIRKSAGAKERKLFIRFAEAFTIAITIALLPLIMKSQSVMTFIQSFYGDVLGVVVGIYLVGMFSKRTSPVSAFAAMILSLFAAVLADNFTSLNFVYIGFFSFVLTVLLATVLSRFEKPVSVEKLKNLTIHTLEDVKGPFVGLKTWSGLKRTAIIFAIAWLAFSAGWESLMHFLVSK